MVATYDERPTPVPMGDDDEDCATTVFHGQLLPPPPKTPAPEPAPQSAVSQAPPSNPPVSMVVERAVDAAIVRDTIVDPPRSRWQRFKDGAARFSEAFMRDFFGTEPSLSSKRPPVPTLPRGALEAEQGEQMLFALLHASPQYQRAALEVARHALSIRRGDKAYVDFLVHFTLSRLPPDEQGRIGITRLREALPARTFAGEIAPALIRLEEQGLVFLVLDTQDGDPMNQILRSKITHVELREPV